MGGKRGPAKRSNRKLYRLLCEWCGNVFDCSRPDGTTCGNRCKLRFTRWKRKVLATNGTVMKWGPRGEWFKCLAAFDPAFNGHYSYDRRGSQK